MPKLIVGMGDGRVSQNREEVLVTYALGSCIALAVFDPVVNAGGLLHFVLPESSLDAESARRFPCRYADTGAEWLLRQIYALGARRERMVAWLAGGASMGDEQRRFDIGRKNHGAVRRILADARIPVTKEDVGGAVFRTVILEVASGRFLVRRGVEPVPQPEPDRRLP